jgi:DNA invertase Pin-like site-specific DNA recombinase
MVCVRFVGVTPSIEAEEREGAATRTAGPGPAPVPPAIVREATRVKRLVYTRTQAAEALGISRSTFNRRVLPLIETLEMPWGARLVPVDELQRLLAEKRRLARKKTQPAPPGRPAALAPAVADQIRTEHAAGKSFAEIARELNATETPTAHGGAQWWPSTVRAILNRASG